MKMIWSGLIANFKDLVKNKTKKNFPQDVNEPTMLGAISAVFLSWESKRAKIYRKINWYTQSLGHGRKRSSNGIW